MSSFNNEKKLYILDLNFDYFAISQYRDLHLQEINMVERIAMTRKGELKLRMSIDRKQTRSKHITSFRQDDWSSF